MNQDFPRILALLRKERHLSQKQASIDLGVAQALLSHYEKGKRECGLDFLVRAADYYNVSTDYLLGRSSSSSGENITEEDLPEIADDKRADRGLGSLSAILTKKLLINSIELIYIFLARIRNQALTQNISNMLSLNIYRVFRLIHKTNPSNDPQMFSISEEMGARAASGHLIISEGYALEAIANGQSEPVEITTSSLENEFQKQGSALLSLIRNCETLIRKS